MVRGEPGRPPGRTGQWTQSEHPKRPFRFRPFPVADRRTANSRKRTYSVFAKPRLLSTFGSPRRRSRRYRPPCIRCAKGRWPRPQLARRARRRLNRRTARRARRCSLERPPSSAPPVPMNADHLKVGADVGSAGAAGMAVPAGDHGIGGDVITDTKRGDARAQRFHRARELVADDRGIDREGIRTVQDVHVRSADAGAPDTDRDLTGSGRARLGFEKREGVRLAYRDRHDVGIFPVGQIASDPRRKLVDPISPCPVSPPCDRVVAQKHSSCREKSSRGRSTAGLRIRSLNRRSDKPGPHWCRRPVGRGRRRRSRAASCAGSDARGVRQGPFHAA